MPQLHPQALAIECARTVQQAPQILIQIIPLLALHVLQARMCLKRALDHVLSLFVQVDTLMLITTLPLRVCNVLVLVSMFLRIHQALAICTVAVLENTTTIHPVPHRALHALTTCFSLILDKLLATHVRQQHLATTRSMSPATALLQQTYNALSARCAVPRWDTHQCAGNTPMQCVRLMGHHQHQVAATVLLLRLLVG